MKPLGAPSRGQLLRRYLDQSPSDSPIDDLTTSTPNLSAYEGFNLLVFAVNGQGVDVGHLSNRPKPTVARLDVRNSEIHGVSNTPINQPWPKVLSGNKRMGSELREWSGAQETEDGLIRRLMDLLR